MILLSVGHPIERIMRIFREDIVLFISLYHLCVKS